MIENIINDNSIDIYRNCEIKKTLKWSFLYYYLIFYYTIIFLN